MKLLSLILIGIIALLHFYIAYFEMFAWEARGPVAFPNFPDTLFADTVVLAGNQGIYNALLAVGLVWTLFIQDALWQKRIASFFLMFVAIAGLYGAATASDRILFVQTIPAVLAFALLHLAKTKVT